jgi:pimeloyl-ACP methyl ester carboxylesterase
VTSALEAQVLEPVELTIDVTDEAALGMPARTTATVYLPGTGALSSPPVICFAFPGGGYSRRYYTLDLAGGASQASGNGAREADHGQPDHGQPDHGQAAHGQADHGQAGWHAARGWIFVACDSLGFGDATAPEGDVLTYENIALGNKATVAAVLARLESGTLVNGYPPVTGTTTLGVGQSMGGCFTIVLQGQHRVFDGVAALGFSGIHTVVPSRPGTPAAAWPWLLRGSDLASPAILNQAALAAAAGPTLAGQDSLAAAAEAGEHPFTWAFHWDTEPADIVAIDMAASAEAYDGPLPAWRSPSTPACGIYMVAPGTVATEAASITVPVLIAVGERDVVPNPWLEPTAFRSSTDISVFVCPRMAHMHNFADTRQELWARIHSWGTGVAAMRAARG